MKHSDRFWFVLSLIVSLSVVLVELTRYHYTWDFQARSQLNVFPNTVITFGVAILMAIVLNSFFIIVPMPIKGLKKATNLQGVLTHLLIVCLFILLEVLTIQTYITVTTLNFGTVNRSSNNVAFLIFAGLLSLFSGNLCKLLLSKNSSAKK